MAGTPHSNGHGGLYIDTDFLSENSVNNDLTSPINAHLLKEQEMERERLMKETFNMKLRINFLEDQLLRYKSGNAFDNEDLENENLQLRLVLEEKKQELEERDVLLVKARNAIESLHEDLRIAQQQVQNSNTDNHNGSQLVDHLEQRIEQMHGKEEELSSYINEIEEKYNGIVLQEKEHMNEIERLQEIQSNKSSRISELDDRVRKLEGELNTCRAQLLENEKFVNSKSDLFDEMKLQYNELKEAKKELEDKHEFEKKTLEDNILRLEKLNSSLEDGYGLEMQKLKEKNLKLEEQSSFAVEKATDEMNKNIHHLQEENSNLISDLHDIEGKNTHLEERMAIICDEMNALKIESSRAHSNLQERKDNELSAIKDELHSSKIEINSISRQVDEERHQNKLLLNKCQELEKRCSIEKQVVMDEYDKKHQLMQKEFDDMKIQFAKKSKLLKVDKETELEQQLNNVSELQESVRKKIDIINSLEREIEVATKRENQISESKQAIEEQNSQLLNNVKRWNYQLSILVEGSTEETTIQDCCSNIEDNINKIKQLKRIFRKQSDHLNLTWHKHFDSLIFRIESFESRLKKCIINANTLSQNITSEGESRNIVSNIRLEYKKKKRNLESDIQKLQNEKDGLSAENFRAEEKVQSLLLKLEKQSELESQCNRLSENNRVLILELEERRAITDTSRRQLNSTLKQNNNLLLAVDALKHQVAERDRHLDYYMEKLQALTLTESSNKPQKPNFLRNNEDMWMKNISQDVILRQVEETQEMIRKTSKHLEIERDNYLASKNEKKRNNSNSNYFNQSHCSISNAIVLKLDKLKQDIVQLVSKTISFQEYFIKSFENQSVRDNNPPNKFIELQRDCYKLLECNSSLALRLEQVVHACHLGNSKSTSNLSNVLKSQQLGDLHESRFDFSQKKNKDRFANGWGSELYKDLNNSVEDLGKRQSGKSSTAFQANDQSDSMDSLHLGNKFKDFDKDSKFAVNGVHEDNFSTFDNEWGTEFSKITDAGNLSETLKRKNLNQLDKKNLNLSSSSTNLGNSRIHEIYQESISCLSRLGSELRDVDSKIRTYANT